MSNEESKSFIQRYIEKEKERDPAFAEAYEKERLSIKIASQRVRAGLTQAEVGEKLGMKQSNVARIEKNPLGVKTETLLRYLRAIGISHPLNLTPETMVVRESSARGTYRRVKESEGQ